MLAAHRLVFSVSFWLRARAAREERLGQPGAEGLRLSAASLLRPDPGFRATTLTIHIPIRGVILKIFNQY